MKKSTLFYSLTFVFLMLLSVDVSAQKFSDLDKSPMDAASFPQSYKESDKLVKVVYSRPQLKKRALEELAPNGEVWRTGANEATEITFYMDMKMGDTEIKAGTYSFFVIPGAKMWTAILSTDLNVWGAYTYNKENDVARLEVPVTKGKESIEAFSIAFDKSEGKIMMHMGWSTTRIAVPFSK